VLKKVFGKWKKGVSLRRKKEKKDNGEHYIKIQKQYVGKTNH